MTKDFNKDQGPELSLIVPRRVGQNLSEMLLHIVRNQVSQPGIVAV